MRVWSPKTIYFTPPYPQAQARSRTLGGRCLLLLILDSSLTRLEGNQLGLRVLLRLLKRLEHREHRLKLRIDARAHDLASSLGLRRLGCLGLLLPRGRLLGLLLMLSLPEISTLRGVLLIAPRALATSGRRPGVRAKRAARGVAGRQIWTGTHEKRQSP